MSPPFFIGLAGGSASGKTTLVRKLEAALAPLQVEVMHLDKFFKPRSRLPRYYSPSRRGRFPNFNHARSISWSRLRRALAQPCPRKIRILEGHLALWEPGVRKRMDLKVFLDCPQALRLKRRLARGVRGWTRKEHRAYWNDCVLPGHRRFIQPTRREANLRISSGAGRGAVRLLAGQIRAKMNP